MSETGCWHCPPELVRDEALEEAVLAAHEAILEELAAEDSYLNLNRGLPVTQRALRRIEDWRVLLLLTPWMLARLYFPDRAPAIPLPAGWTAGERAGASYRVLGPGIRFALLGESRLAHLSYHPALGHYLLQPLCLDLEAYADAEAVFAAWGDVIRRRDEIMDQRRRDCPMQKELSRRELFAWFRN